ncbi:hydrogenase maturation protease [Demequina capsici]|uniref:Hydrogenase maturation protease n=1 Tax=Demequina capsici TaxID=3075620 RepID=A0AA96F7R6_9MICO|nr:hydrogenase maturation protease [Demequina sp. OYTSA14]WNM23501.1 hydrogenase maturation protease [Demequina sp. OYTSA14]
MTATTPRRPDVILIGLGQPDRGDDAVGPAIVARVRARHGDHLTVVTREDPTALVQVWDGHRAAVVADAVVSGAPPGAVSVTRAGAADPPLPTHAFTASGRGGSHAFGVAGAVELARVLGTLPQVVVIVGVEAASFAHGPMSPQVEDAIDDAVATVEAELTAALRRAPTTDTHAEVEPCA